MMLKQEEGGGRGEGKGRKKCDDDVFTLRGRLYTRIMKQESEPRVLGSGCDSCHKTIEYSKKILWR